MLAPGLLSSYQNSARCIASSASRNTANFSRSLDGTASLRLSSMSKAERDSVCVYFNTLNTGPCSVVASTDLVCLQTNLKELMKSISLKMSMQCYRVLPDNLTALQHLQQPTSRRRDLVVAGADVSALRRALSAQVLLNLHSSLRRCGSSIEVIWEASFYS
jgi:hypothetical protein